MILLSGGSGFIGKRVLSRLKLSGQVKVLSRNRSINWPSFAVPFHHHLESISAPDPAAFADVEVVIHTAGLVHHMGSSLEALEELSKINVDGTLSLATAAAKSGVRRFIFLSSIKVNGESTKLGKPFVFADQARPSDPYSLSKFEAEQGLQKIAKETGMEVVIIRPPLVYGPGVKGNFANLIKLLDKGVPLPFGAIHNQRSMIALDNLVDLIITCIDHPNARNQIFLASDGVDLSTTELLQRLAQAMGRSSRLLPIPSKLLTFAASFMGKKPLADRLLGSLQVDISKTRELLDWNPPFTVDDSLRMCFESKEVRQ